MTPPLWLKLNIQEENQDNFQMKLPLFLLWLLAIPLLPIALVLILLWSVVLAFSGSGFPFIAQIACWYQILCALRGFEIDVQEKNKNVFITIS